MPTFTKKAIMNSFMKLLNKSSFDNITVKDIVDDCKINRNTFYYNFNDIYAVVDEILHEEINNIVEKHREYHSWNEGLLYAFDFALQNKKAIFHLYHSSKRQQLEGYLQNVIYSVVSEFVKNQAKGVDVSQNDIDFVATFYSCALTGIIKKWLDDGMKEEFENVIGKTGIIFDNNIIQSLKFISNKK